MSIRRSRCGAELDRIDPAALSGGGKVDLLAVLEEQRRWFEAAHLRVLAAIQAEDDTALGLGQEGVSVALQVPLRTAQARLAQAATLVRDLPRTLAGVFSGALSAGHASPTKPPPPAPRPPDDRPTADDPPPFQPAGKRVTAERSAYRCSSGRYGRSAGPV